MGLHGRMGKLPKTPDHFLTTEEYYSLNNKASLAETQPKLLCLAGQTDRQAGRQPTNQSIRQAGMHACMHTYREGGNLTSEPTNRFSSGSKLDF
jgi:hypothetical protein